MVSPTGPKSIDDAFIEWNRSHRPKDQLMPKRTAELGKTIFVRYSQERGFWIEKQTKTEAFAAFCAKPLRLLHVLSPEPTLGDAQQKQLQNLLTAYNRASNSLDTKDTEEVVQIKAARLRAIYGAEYANAYAILMSPNADEKSIAAIRPDLERILAIRGTYGIGSFGEDLDVNNDVLNFDVVARDAITQYYAQLQKDVFKDKKLPKSLFRELLKAIDVFHLFHAKMLDFSGLSPHQNIFEGFNSTQACASILDDLIAFQSEKGESLPKEEAIRLAWVIDSLHFAATLTPEIEEATKDKSAAAKKISEKLQELAKQQTGGSMIMTGGYATHAILYKIEPVQPVSEGSPVTFKLSLINTGAGVTNVSSEFVVKKLSLFSLGAMGARASSAPPKSKTNYSALKRVHRLTKGRHCDTLTING
ncbi:MAG: hypothetical protein H0X51_00745 [Parachlamydiaceae bacterium]|nr:hypothetical protein [Parachlamydiaceae bacterium]